MQNGISSARALLLAGIAAGSFAAPAAYAQDTADEPAVAEDDGSTIIVTARRREETLIEVPIAITAIGGAQLERSGAIDITDVANVAPNVTLENSRATNSTLSSFIRGVGQQDPVAGFEQGVGIYLDDVYLNRPQAAVLDIYDVERIEVLRGPQGTLYGRNTIGGAVKYVTRRLPNRFALNARATYGEYNQADAVVTASAPIGDGTLRVGGSVARLTRDGFGKNLTTGFDNYDKNVWAGRASAEVHAGAFFARLAGDYTHDKSHARGGHRLIPSQLTNAPVLDDVYDTRGGLNDPKQDVKSYGVSLFMEANPNDILTFRSISSYRHDKSSTPIDFDALPSVDVDVPGRYINSQTSQEIQVLIDTGRLNGLIGAYYLDAKAATPFEVRLFTTSPVALPGLTALTNAIAETNTIAGFADFTYDLTDQFAVSVGGRYTWDQRQATILRQNYLFGPSPLFGGKGTPLGGPSTNFSGQRSFTKFTPRASVSFKPTPDHNIYLSYSQGFKGGGFDPRGVGTNAPDLDGNGTINQLDVARFLSFAPEKVDSYEVGYKASLLDRRLNLALAAFRADYSDVQIPGSVACLSGGVPTFCGVTSNAGKARFQGFEAETSGRVGEDWLVGGDSLRFSGAVGYIDAEYKQYITNIAAKPTDVAAFRHVQNTPKWTFNQSMTYSAPVGSGSIDLTEQVSYRSKTYQFEIANPFIDQDGYALLDASIVYHGAGDHWSLGLYGKNLTDQRYKTSGYTFVAANATTGALTTRPNGTLIPSLGAEGVLSAFYGNPRQVFVTGTVKF